MPRSETWARTISHSFFWRAFIEATALTATAKITAPFPFLYGGTFMEAALRHRATRPPPLTFPFLLGGTFIEGSPLRGSSGRCHAFPFLFGGTFKKLDCCDGPG